MRLQITAQALQLVQHASSLLGDLRNFGRDMAELDPVDFEFGRMAREGLA